MSDKEDLSHDVGNAHKLGKLVIGREEVKRVRQTIVFENIRAELARRNYGTKDVAEVLGVDRSTAGAKLSGKREFSITEAFKMSACLFDGLPLEYLFFEKKIERGAVNTTLSR